MPAQPPRFYRGDLPPRSDDIDKVRRALKRGPALRQALVERTRLSLTRTLCAIDALIRDGEAAYDPASKSFAAVERPQ